MVTHILYYEYHTHQQLLMAELMYVHVLPNRKRTVRHGFLDFNCILAELLLQKSQHWC